MAGFGSLSLTQTAIGTLLDQRAVVLYKQPQEETDNWFLRNVATELWGNALKYEELFSGLLGDLGAISTIANVSGTNPYGITYIDAKVSIESELCDHPVEDGSVITDMSIKTPVSAIVTVAMPTFFAEKIYNQMYKMYDTKKDKIILQTKYGLYKNMVLQNMEYELEHDTVDRTKFILTLREIVEVKSYNEFNQIADMSDATTINIGSQMAG